MLEIIIAVAIIYCYIVRFGFLSMVFLVKINKLTTFQHPEIAVIPCF